MAFYGKLYKFEKNENFEDFVKSLGIPEDRAELLRNSQPQQKITKDGDEYTLTFIVPNVDTKNIKFKSGVEFEEQIHGDLTAKSIITVDGNVATQKQTFEKLGGRTITLKKEFSDNSLVETITTPSWDGTAKRYYKV